MKIVKILLGILVVLSVIAVGGYAFLMLRFPAVGPAKDVNIVATPDMIARGEYLANHVTVCMDCHSEHDINRFANPVIPGTEGKGEHMLGHEHGFPGELYAPNITPAALNDWSDGEILRAIVEGVSKDGRPLFPLMPYTEYRHLSQQDANAIVAYLRTLPAIESELPTSTLDFPLNLIVRTMPKPYEPPAAVNPADTIAYGKYLADIGGCRGCHSLEKQGTPVEGMEWAGGNEYPSFSGGTVRASNISPDPETGIGLWTEDFFVTRFKAYASDTLSMPVTPGSFNTLMPWRHYAGMTEDDLRSIYRFLRTVPPVKNRVERFTPPE